MAGTTAIFNAQGLKPVGFEQITGIGTAKALTVPGTTGLSENRLKAKAALVSADGQSVRLRFDGTDPTAAIGHLIANGDHFWIVGDLSNVKVIQTAATAVVNVTYFG